jgi:hypothetical protein
VGADVLSSIYNNVVDAERAAATRTERKVVPVKVERFELAAKQEAWAKVLSMLSAGADESAVAITNAIDLEMRGTDRKYRGKDFVGYKDTTNDKDILVMQELYNALVKMGYIEGKEIKVDGIYGHNTETAILKMQGLFRKAVPDWKKKGMKLNDGAFGVDTRDALTAWLAANREDVAKKVGGLPTEYTEPVKKEPAKKEPVKREEPATREEDTVQPDIGSAL